MTNHRLKNVNRLQNLIHRYDEWSHFQPTSWCSKENKLKILSDLKDLIHQEFSNG